MNEPIISIIICCYNSEERIGRTLECLAKQEFYENLSFEVIIVDNNSTDNTAEFAVKTWAKFHLSIPIIVVYESFPGLSNARKKGISESRGKIIVFCDDDNGLDKNYLKIAYDIMQSNQEVGIIGGLGIIKTEGELPNWFPILKSAYAVGAQFDKDGDVTNLGGYIWGAGMVIRKVIFEKLFKAGFQSLLSDRKAGKLSAGGDTELCILTKQLGYLIYYDSRLKYFHFIPQNRLTWNYLIKLWEGFSRSQVYFEMYENYFRKKISTVNDTQWRNAFRNSVAAFFSGSSTLNWYKSIYLSFMVNKEGYLPGLEKRKFFYKMKELLRLRFSYNTYTKKIEKFKDGT